MDKKKFIPIIGALGLMAVTSSCFYDPYYYGPPSYRVSGSFYPYGYYYYPSVQVYFQYSTGLYFYISNGQWIHSRILPPRYRLNPRDRVFLRLKSNTPYKLNPKHVEKYRPRPRIKPTPSTDRNERASHLKWYKEQQIYKKQKLIEEKKEKKSKDKRRR